ncbi:MAG: exo-alpha-sialidase [Planctomycetaceae bacterium]|nr:exo-alpha-sialidase [Planctomycetaceae bacterium]
MKTLSGVLLLLACSCSSTGPSAAPAIWEPEARAVGKGRDGQILVWPSESPSLLFAAPGEKPGAMDLIYRGSHDEAATFEHPIRVNPIPGEVGAHGENAPQIRIGPGTELMAAWEGRGEIRFARCVDFGHSFLPAVTVNDDGADAYQSFFAMETGPDGSLVLAWIDFRDSKTEPPGTASIYLARSSDRGATFEKNVKVAGGVCPCCRPAIAIGRDGTIHVAWRHVLEQSARDIVVSSSTDRGRSWSAPVRVANDDWRLDGCPHSGPTMAVLPSGLFIAWYTGAKDKASLQVARSTDGGKSFGAGVPVESTLNDANHPHLVAVGPEAWILFQARTADGSGGWGPLKPALVRCDADGRPGAPSILPSLGGSVAYPRLSVGQAGRLYATWTEVGADGTQVVLCRGRRAPQPW